MKVTLEDIKADRAESSVLVTGGAGFIGSHVVEALLKNGFRVRVLDDLSNGSLDNLPMPDPNLKLIVSDVLDARRLAEAMRGVQYCIHLAAQVAVERSLKYPVESAVSNVLGFINVLEACREARIKRLVYASSAAVYGEPEFTPLSEQASLNPISPYGLEKLVDEQYAALYKRLYDMQSIGLRFFNVYGPRQDPNSPYSGVISIFTRQIASGQPPVIFGDGKQTRDFIHVRDVAHACLVAMNSSYCGVCNIASGKPVNLLELINVLNSCMETDIRPEFDETRDGDIRHSCGDCERLEKMLNFQSVVSLMSGLDELAHEYRIAAGMSVAGGLRRHRGHAL